ncbi:PfkB family carbohydrate kinase [Leucobacter sp. L43]|uniref:PfkB family carbohydrate kinase n=1 Tax=Leucobacter sp. L43 TaxID=2798040 RepID=UPI00190515B7|nr:PfkB family carbohydrate kinase [Leucobacter sp. L43]
MPRSPRLAVVGSINIDLIARTATLPRPGETVGGGTFSRLPGGKGANQAIAAAALGITTRMIGAVGDDPDGALVRAALVDAGVEASGVRTASEPTGVALIGIDAAGENQISVCPGANAAVAVSADAFAPGEAVLVQLEVPMSVVVDAARACTGFFAVNAAPAAELPAEVLQRADLVIVNETEFAAIPALHGDRAGGASGAGREAAGGDARAAGPLVAVSLGADGAKLLRDGVVVARASSRAVAVRSTVGAGDAFCAALVAALISGVPEDAALAAACAVGAAAVADERSQPALLALEEYLPE